MRTPSCTRAVGASGAGKVEESDKNLSQESKKEDYASSTRVKSNGSNGKEDEMMERLLKLLPRAEMKKNGGMWRETWIRRVPDAMDRAMNDFEERLRSGPPIRKKAAMLLTLVRQFEKWDKEQVPASPGKNKEADANANGN
jgi:hypothetical protein